MNKTIGSIAWMSFVLLLLLLLGCESFDGTLARQTHITEYQKSLADKTDTTLSESKTFGLNDCIETALQNNLSVRSSEIQKKIAKLEKKVAFSNFLPAVSLDYQDTRWDKQPKTKIGSSAVAMHDKHVRDVTWQVQMSIFDPSTWFLYAMRQRGEEITNLVTHYTRQMTILETTINYYHTLSLKQAELALQSQLEAAKALRQEISNLYEEGLVTTWQTEQSQVLVLNRETSLHSVQYAIKQAESDLLVSMGLSPLADIQLRTEEPVSDPNESLEELVAEALVSNPQLQISDRQIAIEKEKVKTAFAGFLPQLVGFAGRTNSSDSYLLYDNYWTYGLAGTMTLFNGFANINEYKAAKQRQQVAFIEREQQTLTLMLEVVKAHLNLSEAREQSLLAQKSFDTESMHFAEIEEKWREGLIQSSEMLDVLADKNTAQMEFLNSQFQLQVSRATLYNVMGVTDKDYKGYSDDHSIAQKN